MISCENKECRQSTSLVHVIFICLYFNIQNDNLQTTKIGYVKKTLRPSFKMLLHKDGHGNKIKIETKGNSQIPVYCNREQI